MKLLTMTDAKYFQYGKLFMETRHRVNAECTCFTPMHFKDPRLAMCESQGIHCHPVSQADWDTKMQFLKFPFLSRCDTDGAWFCDWDTFFRCDLPNLGEKLWNDKSRMRPVVGITVRPEMIAKNCYRAYANGGVIYSYKAKPFWDWAGYVVEEGGADTIPEYNEIWKTLEDPKRPEHKRHHRTNHRWWVDQVFLSAIAWRALNRPDIDLGALARGQMQTAHDIEGVDVDLLPCSVYNVLDAEPDPRQIGGAYICHLKSKSGAPASLKDG